MTIIQADCPAQSGNLAVGHERGFLYSEVSAMDFDELYEAQAALELCGPRRNRQECLHSDVAEGGDKTWLMC